MTTETVADFKQRLAALIRSRETGKRYSLVGAARAPECVLRKPQPKPKKKGKNQ